MDDNPIKQAVRICGRMNLAKALGVSYQAVQRWERLGRMPKTEWTSETSYSSAIEELTHGEVRAADLLSAFQPPAALTPAHSEPQ